MEPFTLHRLTLTKTLRHAEDERHYKTFNMHPESTGRTKKNYKLVLEYDGTNYHGWQRQKGVLTIQEVVETRLAILTQACRSE